MFTITIRTDNAAFQDGDGQHEIARILRKVADEIEGGIVGTYPVLDVNGNKVGRYSAKGV